MYQVFDTDMEMSSMIDKLSFQFKQKLFENPALNLENIQRAIPKSTRISSIFRATR